MNFSSSAASVYVTGIGVNPSTSSSRFGSFIDNPSMKWRRSNRFKRSTSSQYSPKSFFGLSPHFNFPHSHSMLMSLGYWRSQRDMILFGSAKTGGAEKMRKKKIAPNRTKGFIFVV